MTSAKTRYMTIMHFQKDNNNNNNNRVLEETPESPRVAVANKGHPKMVV